jgi:hypothetical protein
MTEVRISQSTARRALLRFEQAHEADADLSLEQIEQDEATRAPANARKQRRLTRARRVRAQRRFNRTVARQLIKAHATTAAPSRGAARLAARLLAEYAAQPLDEENAA